MLRAAVYYAGPGAGGFPGRPPARPGLGLVTPRSGRSPQISRVCGLGLAAADSELKASETVGLAQLVTVRGTRPAMIMIASEADNASVPTAAGDFSSHSLIP